MQLCHCRSGDMPETVVYLLNLVPSKSVPKTPVELWLGRKPSLSHIRIWGCPAHVLNKDADKLESRTEVMLFVGYPKQTKGGYFYSPKNLKVVVSTNARFLEEDSMINHKSKTDVVLQELQNDGVAQRNPCASSGAFSAPTPQSDVQGDEPPETAPTTDVHQHVSS